MTALLLGAAPTTWQWREALAQRDAAKLERDRATIASQIRAYLYANSGDTNNGQDRARGLIAWLRKRLPGDESRQADALTAFATSVNYEKHGNAEEPLSTTIAVLGADYRHQVIKALQAGSNKYRDVYSAMLTINDSVDSNISVQFESFVKSAIRELPDDPFVWHVAAVYCPQVDKQTRCLDLPAAETLVRIAPDNMYHWLLLVLKTTDEPRKREALHEAAKRTEFDDYVSADSGAYAKAISAAAVPPPPLIARPDMVLAPKERPESIIAQLEACSLQVPSWPPLIHYCLPANLDALDPQTRADCLTVGTRMARSNGGILSRMIAWRSCVPWPGARHWPRR